MKQIGANDVQVYEIAGGSSSGIPAWLAKQHARKLKKDAEWQNRVELIQDFEFPEASLRVKRTRDGRHIVATGVYKPQMRVFELADMAMKFDRHTDCDNVQFEIISDDWSKSVHLQSDRSIEFHTPSGMHYRTRIPRFGRDLAYHYPSCDLLVGAAGPEVYRLNLEQGRFLAPLETHLPGVNCTAINPVNQLWAFGGENGIVEYWDPRTRSAVRRTPIISPQFGDDAPQQVTKIAHAADGLTVAVGTSQGRVLLYDLRSSEPVVVKDHMNDAPIVAIDYHVGGSSPRVVSADRRSVKVWDRNSGAAYAAIEPPNEINDMLLFSPDSGLVMLANEGTQMQTYFVPSLGPAPRWCSFLDHLTEEMETAPQGIVYDDYKFVTRQELDSLALSHLVGTPLLRAYMHGYFIDLRLYEKAKAIANPFAYREHRERELQAKLERERGSRIGIVKKLPKVNRRLAAQLLAKARLEDASASKSSNEDEDEDDDVRADRVRAKVLHEQSQADVAANPTGDSRFASLFNDPDFAIDENTEEFRLRYPVRSQVDVGPELDGDSDEESEGSAEVLPPAVEPLRDSSKTPGEDASGKDAPKKRPHVSEQPNRPSPPNRPSQRRKRDLLFTAYSSADPVAHHLVDARRAAGGVRTQKQTLGKQLKAAPKQTEAPAAAKRPFRASRPSGNMTFQVGPSEAPKDNGLTLSEQMARRERERQRLGAKRSVKPLNLKRLRNPGQGR